MDSDLAVHNGSNIQAFSTHTISSCITKLIYDTKFYITKHNASVLLSSQDSPYMQLVQPHSFSPQTAY